MIKWYKIQSFLQDLFFTKFFYPLVFKEFRIPTSLIDLDKNEKQFCYIGTRFRWFNPILCYLTGCKHLWWADNRQSLGEHYIARKIENKFKASCEKVVYVK